MGLRDASASKNILRNGRTSTSIWHTLDTQQKKNIKKRKKRLLLHSCGPLWTIFTGNQWEISKVSLNFLNSPFREFLTDPGEFLNTQVSLIKNSSGNSERENRSARWATRPATSSTPHWMRPSVRRTVIV